MLDTVLHHLPDLAMAAALAWGAGIRLYLVVFALGLASTMGWMVLPEHLSGLANPMVMTVAGFMAVMEMFADKLPWLDSVWDMLQTFIRIPAGAAMAAAVFGDAGTGTALSAALLGGTLTATTHFAKAGTRALVNTSPEPVSNVVLSTTEDGMVMGGLWMALANPITFLILLVVFLIAAVVVLRLTYKGIRRLFGRKPPKVGLPADRLSS